MRVSAMARRKPITQESIKERKTWPETQAALRGPESYDELGILSSAQRRQLVQPARVKAEMEKPFIDELVCYINGYRFRKRCHAQETPAAVSESMRRLIDLVDAYRRNVLEFPLYMICELKPPLPTDDWFEHAKEKLRQKEQWLKGHRYSRFTEALIMHAWTLQKLAGKHSRHLALDWLAMRRWLACALEASMEPPPKGHGQAAFLDQLMLPRAASGAVDLAGRPPALDSLKANLNPEKGT
jgi:hypothetical protein